MGVCDFSSDGLLCSWVLIFHSLTTPTSDFTLEVSCFTRVCLLSCFGWGEDLFLPAPTQQVCVFDFFSPGDQPVVAEISPPLLF